MSIVRRWATFRGERCLVTTVGISAPYTRGQQLVVGNRAYVVTRVLRAGGIAPDYCWEIWARRRVNKANRRDQMTSGA